jgi:hypothetical protein
MAITADRGKPLKRVLPQIDPNGNITSHFRAWPAKRLLLDEPKLHLIETYNGEPV